MSNTGSWGTRALSQGRHYPAYQNHPVMINPYAKACLLIRRTGRGGEDGEGAKKQREHDQQGSMRTLQAHFHPPTPTHPRDLTKSHFPHLVNGHHDTYTSEKYKNEMRS